MCSTADVDAAFAVDAKADGATVRQGRLIDQVKSQGHWAIFRPLNTTLSAAARAANFAAAGRSHQGHLKMLLTMPLCWLIGRQTRQRQGPCSSALNHNASKIACSGALSYPLGSLSQGGFFTGNKASSLALTR
jgi:hypothetical protein